MSIERTIKSAKIRETGKIIESDEYFQNKQHSYLIRTEYNRGNITFECLSCKRKLALYQSNKHNIYLKHFPNSEFCELKEEALTTKEQQIFSQILVSKESERHIFLKKKIGELLKLEKNISNVKIDDFYIFNDKKEKRRPDVYCKYLDKEIVFEIQLSNLSQKYILGRYDFYKEKGIYLIWILDNFDVEGKTTMELDIKYLSQHQNYFRFDDLSKNFKLNCKFKQTHLNTSNQFYDEWGEVDIALNKLNFDQESSEVFFYNFLENKKTILNIQKKNALEIEKKIKIRRAEKKQQRIAYKIRDFIEDIVSEKEKYKPNFTKLLKELNDFEEPELQFLNQKLKLDEKERIFVWLKKGNESDYEFLKFILESYHIELDINRTDKNGHNVLFYLYNNKEIYNKDRFLILLFKKEFKFSEIDKSLLKRYFEGSYEDYQRYDLVFNLANQTPKWLMNTLFEYKSQKVLCVIESCLSRKIIGTKLGWKALINNSIHHYPEYWSFIEKALKSNGLFNELIIIDKKSVFQKKLENHHNNQPKYNRNFGHLFQHLYPELCY